MPTQLIAIYAGFRVSTSVVTLISLWRLRVIKPELPRQFKVPGGKIGLAGAILVPSLLFAWALVNSEQTAARWALVGLAFGPAAYYVGCFRRH